MKNLLATFRSAFADWREDNASRLAASLAFFAVLSLAPLLLAIVGIVGLVYGDDAARGQLVTQLQDLMGQENAKFLQDVIERGGRDASGVAAVFGFVLLLFGASGVFVQLQDGLNTIWEVAQKPGRGIKGAITQRLGSIGVVLGVAVLLLASAVASAVLAGVGGRLAESLPGGTILLHVAQIVVSIGVLTLLFALVFKVLPDVRIAWRDVWMGAAVTAVLFTLAKFAIGLYLGYTSVGSAYGAAGTLVAVLVWIWLSAQVFYFGAEFTQAQARRQGRVLEPDRDAVPLTAEKRAQQGLGPCKREAASGEARGTVAAVAPDRALLPVPIPAAARARGRARAKGRAVAALGGVVLGFLVGHVVGRSA